MDDATWDRVRANIFEAAWPVALSLPLADWHKDRVSGCIDADVLHSSQALALDYFGTLDRSNERSAVLNGLAAALRLPKNGSWVIKPEFKLTPNLLNEPRKTQIDVLAEGPNSFIVFECKFTEAGGGCCSQPSSITRGPHKGKAQCNGRYELQENPINGRQGYCALTAKGIHYWEYIPQIFEVPKDRSRTECPFAGENYQWMRNVVACAALSRHRGVPGAFVLVYARRRGLPMSDKVESGAWPRGLGQREPCPIAVRPISYQELVVLALSAARSADGIRVWNNLASWIHNKISSVRVK